MKITRIIAMASLLVAVSCYRVEVQTVGYGSLQMSMDLNDQTKAFTDEDLYNSAIVNIYKNDFSGLVRSYSYTAMPSPFYLASGEYRVDVLAGECVAAQPAAASWENKSYKGSETFTIVENQNQSVQVTANLSNAVTSIIFESTVPENFAEGFSLTIGLDPEDESTQLKYEAGKSGKEGYYIVSGLVEPSFFWTFSGTLLKDGSEFTKSGRIDGIEAGKLYKMSLKYTVTDGSLGLSLMVDESTDVFDDTIIFEPVSTGLAASPAYEIWAAHATLHADVDADSANGATIQFAYSSNDTDWVTTDAVKDSEATWKADIKGLTPSTKYTYKLLINGEQIGETMTFTTEDAPNFPNASFEYVSLVTGESYYKFYDPKCGVAEGMTMFWGSGNGEGADGVNGSASMGITITTVDTQSKIDGKQSVCAQTSQMAGILAAGNLFAGQFKRLIGTEGGEVNFGRPWKSRPSAMKLYCKYITGKMDIIKGSPSGMSLSKNDYDRAQLKVAIGTWDYKKYGGTKDSPVLVNTTDESTFVDFYTDPSTIANGDLIIYHDGYVINNGQKVSATTSDWIEYTIPIDYHSLTDYPTHVVVSFASSQFGDYFTGYSGSKLWIDKVELVYE